MKPIVTDTYSFDRLRQYDCLYVDKTRYIWQLVSGASQAYFLSRPRRFGKSLLISTLSAFFEGKKDLFKGLDIERLSSDTVWQTYPVIRLDMAKISAPTGVADTVSALQIMLREIAGMYGVSIDIQSPGVMFERLISKVFEQTGKPVVILVDEYDKPILDALDKPHLNEILNLMSFFYQQIKSATDKERFVFITGVTRFAHTSLFSGANNLTDISDSLAYATLLGYTQQELESVFSPYLEEASSRLNKDKTVLLKTLKTWYDGFCFHPESETIYNPVSIGRFFNEYEFRNYWYDTGTPSFLIKRMKNNPFRLDQFTGDWRRKESFNKYDIEHLDGLELALQTGYLTIAETRREEDGPLECRYDFPNKEVRDSWYYDMLALANRSISADVDAEILKLREALNNCDVDTFMQRLQWFFAGTPYENAGEITEGYFRNHMRTIFVMFGLPNQCEVQVARARIDIIAQTRKCTFVFEVKMQTSSSQTEELLDKAASQAKEKHYADKYHLDSEIVKTIAVVFDRESRQLVKWKEV